jgi:hypothetical protein
MSQEPTKRQSVIHTALIGGVLSVGLAIAGYFAERYVPHLVLISLLKYSIGIIGIVWFFSLTVYNKLSDVTDISGLDYRQHRNIELEIRARLHWFWLRAIFLGLLALCMYVPTILNEANLQTPAWVFGIAFAAFALALFALRRLWGELEEIRELKSYVKEIERREKERAEQAKVLKDAHQGKWESDSKLDGFRKGNDNDTDHVA